MHLFPAIDLRDQQVVRLRQGDYDQQTTYHADPLAQARAFETAGATWLHLVDLDGARSGTPAHLDIIAGIAQQTKLKIEVGGGVRSTDTIDQLLAAGVERVVLGTAALEKWSWFEKLAHTQAYDHRLVLGLDARHGKLATAGWEQQSQTSAQDIAHRVSDWPLAAIVYTDIAVDGMLTGPNVQATAELAAATNVPVVASGGVGSLDDLRALRGLPLQGVIVGRAIYEHRFTVEEGIDALEGNGGI